MGAPDGENTRRCKGQSVGTLELHSPVGPLPARVEAGLRRDVDRLPGARPGPRSPGGDQAAPPRDLRGGRPARAVPPRGKDGGEALASESRRRDRRRRGRRASIHRLRVHRGTHAEAPDPGGGRSARGRGRRLRDRDRQGADRRPRSQARPPRRQAPERPDRSRRAGQGDRLRDRALARAEGNDRDRQGSGHDRLRLPRAGDGRGRRRALRRLLARRRPLRDAHRRRPLPGRDAGRGGDEARQRADAGRAGETTGGLGSGRLGGRPGHHQGPAGPLRHGRRRWFATSSRPWRSRRPAGAGPAARRPACSTRSRPRGGGWAPGAGPGSGSRWGSSASP